MKLIHATFGQSNIISSDLRRHKDIIIVRLSELVEAPCVPSGAVPILLPRPLRELHPCTETSSRQLVDVFQQPFPQNPPAEPQVFTRFCA